MGICAITFIIYLDTSIAPVAIPTITDRLGGGDTAAQWILDSYTLAFACLLLSGGLLGARFGTRRILLGGTAAFGLASVACAIAPTMNVLIAGRGLQGACAAVVVPLSIAALTENFPDPRARAKAIGIWGGTAGVALALGPLVGGVLVSSAGWQSLFWINAPIALGAWIALRMSRRVESVARRGKVDVIGQVFFVVVGAGATLALVEGPHQGWTHPFGLFATAVAAAALMLFVWWERRTETPMLPPGLLRIPEVFVACAVNFFGLFGLYGVLFILTLHLQGALGLSPMETGLQFLPLFGAIGAGSLGASYVAGRLGIRATMLVGLGSICVGLLGLMSIPAGMPFAVYGVALALLGIGIPLSGGVVAIAAMVNAVPTEWVGAASGAMNTFRQFGAVFGVAIAAIASPRVGSEVTSMSATFAIAALGALAGVIMTVVALRPSKAKERRGQAT